jgi:hypothetical protein
MVLKLYQKGGKFGNELRQYKSFFFFKVRR